MLRAKVAVCVASGTPALRATLLCLMAEEGLVCRRESKALEFECEGASSGFRRFAARAMSLPGIESVSVHRTMNTSG
jgi:hypothetical protein